MPIVQININCNAVIKFKLGKNYSNIIYLNIYYNIKISVPKPINSKVTYTNDLC